MKKVSEKESRVAQQVWNNMADKRYVPKAYSDKGPGWGVWDQVEARWVEGSELLNIDASMPKSLS